MQHPFKEMLHKFITHVEVPFAVGKVFDGLNHTLIAPHFVRNQTDLNIEEMQLEGRRHSLIELEEVITGLP
jgi:hypothetical protein